MLVECKHCGAPLDVKDGDRLVRCSYCDATNRVRSMRTIAPQTPMQWQPPPQWTPPPQFPIPNQRPLQVHPVRQPKSGGGWVGCLIFVVIAGAVAIPILFATGLVNMLPIVGLDLDSAGSLATLDFDGTAAPTVTGTTDTGIDASTISGEGQCRGHIPRRPHVLLRTTREMQVVLSATADFDIVMVLRKADGSFVCDDDSGGMSNPIIRTTLGPGAHRVWIGPYHDDASGAFRFDVEGGATTIMPDAPPTITAMVAGPGAAIVGSHPGEARGTIDASTLGAGCRGYIPSAPQLTAQVSEPQLVRFVTRDIQGDLVMVLRHPDGRIVCDDDSGGARNPQIDAMLAAGTTAIWIGTFSQGERHPFTLDVGPPSQQAGRVAPALALAAPTLGAVQLDDVAEVTTYDGVTNPAIDASSLDSRCRGYIGAAPDLALNNRTPREVELTTISRTDLVMVVRGPDGSFVCDDDSGQQMNPQIHQTWAPGTHHVWIGSYHEGERAAFTLRVSEQRVATRRRNDHPIK